MILILTAPGDPHADHVEQKLRARGMDVLRWDPADFPRRATLTVRQRGTHKEVRLTTGGRTFELGAAVSAWMRRPGTPVIHDEISDRMFRAYVPRECLQITQDMWNALDTRWVPGPLWAIRRADSKLLQLQLAAEIGFEVPDTMMTTSPGDFLPFHRAHAGRLIDKMPSVVFPLERNGPVHRYTQQVTTRDVGHARRLRYSPVLFQPNIPKTIELRVTVVGSRVLAAEIHSQASAHTLQDWRRYDHGRTPHAVHALPPELERRCLALVSRLGLRFGAIDLILTRDGRYVFLEINPNGQWLWIERRTGLPISDAICDLLQERGREASEVRDAR